MVPRLQKTRACACICACACIYHPSAECSPLVHLHHFPPFRPFSNFFSFFYRVSFPASTCGHYFFHASSLVNSVDLWRCPIRISSAWRNVGRMRLRMQSRAMVHRVLNRLLNRLSLHRCLDLHVKRFCYLGTPRHDKSSILSDNLLHVLFDVNV